MRKLNLTIVIPCAFDKRIRSCIESIYKTCQDDIEILVSLNNASSEVRDIIKTFPYVKTCDIKEPNLSKAYNNGIEHATRDYVLFMDSDCLFGPQTINLIYEGLKDAKLSKGLVVFRTNDLMSRTIAKVREYTTTDFVSAYIPPLALAKSIKNYVGGYYFNENMAWSGDGEFDYRVRNAGLKINYNNRAVIYHDPLSFIQDIKSGFKYGKGRRIGVDMGFLPNRDYSKISTHTERFARTYEVFRKKGLLASLYYLFIWRPVYRSGYFVQAIQNRLALYNTK